MRRDPLRKCLLVGIVAIECFLILCICFVPFLAPVFDRVLCDCRFGSDIFPSGFDSWDLHHGCYYYIAARFLNAVHVLGLFLLLVVVAAHMGIVCRSTHKTQWRIVFNAGS